MRHFQSNRDPNVYLIRSLRWRWHITQHFHGRTFCRPPVRIAALVFWNVLYPQDPHWLREVGGRLALVVGRLCQFHVTPGGLRVVDPLFPLSRCSEHHPTIRVKPNWKHICHQSACLNWASKTIITYFAQVVLTCMLTVILIRKHRYDESTTSFYLLINNWLNGSKKQPKSSNTKFKMNEDWRVEVTYVFGVR